jgi:hypothetical protein
LRFPALSWISKLAHGLSRAAFSFGTQAVPCQSSRFFCSATISEKSATVENSLTSRSRLILLNCSGPGRA